MSSASSSKLRPSGPWVPAVFSSSIGQRSESLERLADHLAGPLHRRPVRLALARAGVQDDPVRADPVAHPQGVLERGERLAADLPLLGGAVDQVDRMDRRPPRSRESSHRLAEGREVVVRVGGRPPHPRALVEDLDRVAVELDPALERLVSPPAVETCAPISIGAQFLREPPSPPRLRFAPSPTGALHIGGARTALYNWLAGAAVGRRAGAADRGHRPRALDPREHRADPRRAALARARLGRGAGEPVRAARAPRASASRSCSTAGTPTTTRRPRRTCAPGRRRTAGPATAASPREEPGAAVRLRVPDEGETVVDDLIRGPVRFANAARTTS